MTTPNAFTRTSLVDISARTTTALTELGRVMPHMRAVTNAASGHRAVLMRRALAEAEELESELRKADLHAEALKTLFRTATLVPRAQETASCTPPALLPTARSGPAPHDPGGGAAAVVRRQA
jgi:hypothetical protein